MNTGKKFEEDIKNSIDSTAFLYRLRDSGGSWQGGNKSRFTPSNICDFILFKSPRMYLLELKSHKGKSIPYTAIKQLDKLLEVSNRKLENLKMKIKSALRGSEKTAPNILFKKLNIIYKSIFHKQLFLIYPLENLFIKGTPVFHTLIHQ